MVERAGLYEALVGFAHTLTREYDIGDVLHDLTSRIPAVLGVHGVGVSLRKGGRTRFITAGDDAIAQLERAQEVQQQGPGITACASREPLCVPELTAEAARWPAFVAAAREAGITAVASIPMRNHTTIGVIDMYDLQRHDWDAEELAVARVFADIATSYVLSASELDRHRRTAEQLQRALDSRVVIEQAKGIIAADRKVTVDQAFTVLRKYANDRNATLHAVAEAVVRLGLRP